MPSAAPPPANGEGGGGAGTVLLTPGPLTTRPETRAAMNRDWGSRDAAFIELTARVRGSVCSRFAAAGEGFTCVPIQGSGTFAVEAQLGTLVPQGRPFADPGRRRLRPPHGRDLPAHGARP